MPGEEEIIDGVDWVVPVIGRRSREDLYLELKTSPTSPTYVSNGWATVPCRA